jgi:hypothetical protein
MTRHQLTADQAFTLLKRHSQKTHVKLRAIAQTVIQTGDLPVGRRMRPDDKGANHSSEPQGFVRWRHQSDTVANDCQPQR